MKIARIIPIYKSGDKGLFTNYRPVSTLPIFFRLLGRVVYNRLFNFLNKHAILSKNQYGFRKNHSTILALIHLYDKFLQILITKNTLWVFFSISLRHLIL